MTQSGIQSDMIVESWLQVEVPMSAQLIVRTPCHCQATTTQQQQRTTQRREPRTRIDFRHQS